MSSSAPIDSSAHKARSGDDMIAAGSGSKRNDSLKRHRQQSPQHDGKLDGSTSVAIRSKIDTTCFHLPLPPLVSRIPGLNEPLDYKPPERELLPNAIFQEDCSLGLTTIREFRMLQFMNEITDKDNWHVNIMDDDIANQWIREVQEQGDFSERMAQYCLSELRWKAQRYEQTNGLVFVYNGDVVKSDVAISTLHNRLLEAVSKLESSIVQKEYGPFSRYQEWDLVHPSLFPVVYTKTRFLRNQVIGRNDCLKYIACGEVIPKPTAIGRHRTWYSPETQRLPCDVHLKKNETTTSNNKGESITTSMGTATTATTTTTTCQITSYISNLHPHNRADLYAVLEEIIAAAIPLWDRSLWAGFIPENDRRLDHRIPYKDECRFDPRPVDLEDFPAPELYQRDEDAWLEEHEEWLNGARQRCMVYPEPYDFEEPVNERTENLTANMLMERFAATGIQVFVELITIELTPEEPFYGGRPWNVKGRLNEHICASAVYHYSTENITEPHLEFRQMSDNVEEVLYDAEDDSFLKPLFGCWHESGSWFQNVGSIWCKQGRLLAFPNLLLHQVHAFELVDKTRAGHLKFLTLDLVDPNIHILSTARVPPQRQDWWCNNSSCVGALANLSPELQQRILDMLDVPMSVETMQSLRLKLW